MPETSGAADSKSRARTGGGIGNGHLKLSLVLTLVLIVAITAIDLLVLAVNNPHVLTDRHYYMALGNSISFGYQPNLDFTTGFVDDVYADLHKANVTDLVNYACAGESTTTMIVGGCPGHLIHHDAYTGPQLDAAVSFLKAHAGYVNPITLDIGSNDVLSDWDASACMPTVGADNDLATMDRNLTQTILPRLIDALGVSKGQRQGEMAMLNYYNPYAKQCPGSATFVHTLNNHLAADAAQFRIPIVDVYTAFGGDAGMADHICTYTWICDERFHDFHPTPVGYKVIATVVERTLAYPGIGSSSAPVPMIGPMSRVSPTADAPRRLTV